MPEKSERVIPDAKGHVKCPNCLGRGWNPRWVATSPGDEDIFREVCDTCNGTGKIQVETPEKDRTQSVRWELE